MTPSERKALGQKKGGVTRAVQYKKWIDENPEAWAERQAKLAAGRKKRDARIREMEALVEKLSKGTVTS